MPATPATVFPPALRGVDVAACPPALTQPGALVWVGKAETHARLDSKLLRSLGFSQPAFFLEAAPAARHLARDAAREVPAVAMLLVDEDARDMAGLELVRLLRLHPSLAALPVVVISTAATASSVLLAKAAGCTGYLVRPYSPAHARRVCLRALADARAQAPAPEALALLTASAPALCSEAAFLRALAASGPREEDSSAVASPSAATAPPAADGVLSRHRRLARRCVEEGRPDEARRHLEQAARQLALQDRADEAWQALEPLRKSDSLPDPALSLAEALVRENALPSAAGLYVQALRSLPRPSQTHEAMRRACHFTPSPTATARVLATALADQGAGLPAAEIHAAILGPAPAPAPMSPPRRSFLAQFPALHDILVVARHTLTLARQAESA